MSSKLNLPKQVTIMSRVWPIKIERQYAEDPKCFGATDPYGQTITLYLDPHEDFPQRGSVQATLFHECIHAALQSSGAGALLGPEESGKEEALVTALEHALWPLIEKGIFK